MLHTVNKHDIRRSTFSFILLMTLLRSRPRTELRLPQWTVRDVSDLWLCSSAPARVSRGVWTLFRRLCWRSGRQAFHRHTHTAWVVRASVCFSAVCSSASKPEITLNRRCQKQDLIIYDIEHAYEADLHLKEHSDGQHTNFVWSLTCLAFPITICIQLWLIIWYLLK